MSIIIGYSYARFHLDTSGGRRTTVDIPLTNLNGGQNETYEIRKVEHETFGLDIANPVIEKKQIILGAFIHWTFSYQDWITGDSLVNFNTIIQACISGDTITLIPRIDQEWRQFEVKLSSNSFDVGLRTGGSNAQLHKNFVLEFVTTNLVRDFKWSIILPPDTTTYVYGDDSFEEVLYET